MRGVIAAVPTPIDLAGAPVKDLFLEHCAWALGHGCDGLNILGSTGEANSFGISARKEIMSWAASALDRSHLMVGTGTPSLADTIELTRAADDLGYSVALVLPPYYYKPVADQGLIDWYMALHAALGSRDIQIYFYNFPQMTGFEIPVSVITHLNETHPERFAGIKDSSGNLDYCRALTSAMPKLRVFPSSETALGEAAKSGFAGCISATTNQTGALCARVWADPETPDEGLLEQIGKIRAAIAGPTLIPSIKYLVARRSGNAGWERLLPPFCPLAEARKVELDQLAKLLA